MCQFTREQRERAYGEDEGARSIWGGKKSAIDLSSRRHWEGEEGRGKRDGGGGERKRREAFNVNEATWG